MLETDLANHQAKLSTFQLHVTSVTEDIVNMERHLDSVVISLKKTLVRDVKRLLYTFSLLLMMLRFLSFVVR